MSHRLKAFCPGMKYLYSRRAQIGLALFLSTASGFATAATLCVKKDGTDGCKTTISAAVAAAGFRDTVEVWPGIYKEQVTITGSVSLVAKNPLIQPTIDATGFSNGIFVNGLSKAPSKGVSFVEISGFNIHGANYEGILVASASDVMIVDNHVHHNNKGLDLSTTPATCPGIPAFETDEGMDCGEGIHLLGTDRSTVLRNESDHNSGGILITDETGRAYSNTISQNSVHDNPYACGITMASHGPATTLIPWKTDSFGVSQTLVEENNSARNGLGVPGGAGAGVGIFAALSGYAAYANTVVNNDLHDNGSPGVAMHVHAVTSPLLLLPNLHDNKIIGNSIHGNAADSADATTAGPTGISIYSVSGLHGTIISKNVFGDEAIDIAFKAPEGSQLVAHFNDFSQSSIGVDNLGGGSIIATENWWHCPGGPDGSSAACATASGPLIGGSAAPWLKLPFVP